MRRGNFWIRLSLVTLLAACGSADHKTDDTGNVAQPVQSMFQLKADVSGLNGTLVLSNNGSNNVTIQKNGEVVFPASWVSSAQYEIKVMEEPCAQRCVVEESAGQIKTTGTKKISITCAAKTWEYPLNASQAISPINTNATTPSVSMNKYGDMLVAWYQSDYLNLQGYVSEYENRKWKNPNSISEYFSFTGANLSEQSISLNDNNEASILWVQNNGIDYSLYMGDQKDGVWTWPSSSAQTLNVAGGTASEFHPVVKSNSLGEKIAVWTQYAGLNMRVYKAEYRNGTWSFPVNIIDNINPDGTNASRVDAAMNDLGEIVIVWLQSDGTYDRVYKSEYRNGIWTHPVGLTDEVSRSGADAFAPRVAMNNVGDTYITWYQPDNATTSRYQIFVAEKHNGIWTYPTDLADNISPNGKHAKHPVIAVNDQGDVRVASLYRANDSVNVFQVAIQEKNSGASWSSPAILSTSSATTNASNPQMSMDQQGNTVVAWALETSGNVYKAEYRNGSWVLANLTDPINFAPADYDYPAVDVNHCRAALSWSQFNGTVKQIFVAQYH